MQQRMAFQAAVLYREGLYQFTPLTPRQARTWLNGGREPAYQSPLVGSVMGTLAGRKVSPPQSERLVLHKGDEALIIQLQAAVDGAELPYTRPGKATAREVQFSPEEIGERFRLGLLRKLRWDSYVQSITMWDHAYRTGLDRGRYLTQEAILTRYGTYEFSRYDFSLAREWIDEGPFKSQLRYDGACKALEYLLHLDPDVPSGCRTVARTSRSSRATKLWSLTSASPGSRNPIDSSPLPRRWTRRTFTSTQK